jgi:16S rRNA (guanine527-N7)-methyltransferase
MTRIAETLVALGLAPALEDVLKRFSELFQRWNQSINLSAARSVSEIHDHVLDSLHVIPHLQTPAAASRAPRVLDVGAGGGLPGVVVAICLPHTQVTALEPVHKKHAFLRTASRELALTNLEPLAERLEGHRIHDYDAAVSRATFDLREWLLRGAAHVRAGGLVLGFEAIPRSDLPTLSQRHSYQLGGKTRAIIALQTPPNPPSSPSPAE